MADDDYTVRARLIVDTDDARKFEQAASRFEQSGRRMGKASRDVATTSASDSRRASSSWDSAAQRMGSASAKVGRDSDTAARRVGTSWNAAAQRWQSASGQFVSGASRAGGALGGLGSRATSSAGGMRAGAVSAVGFAGKLLLIVGAAGSAAAAIAAIPAAAGALGGALGVLGASFGGIGDALKGHEADEKSAARASAAGGSAAASSARAIRDASKQIGTAQKQQARTARDGAEAVEAASERVEDSKRSEARAYRDLQDAIAEQARIERDSAETIVAAEKRHTEAVKDVAKAEASLDTARQDQIRTMDQLKERVSDLALDQEGAAISVAEAEKAYYRELESSTSTELSKRKALYDLNTAKERQSDLERDSAEAIAENDAAQRAGIEGSEQVIDAKERLAAAQDAEKESAKDLARAQEDGARAIADGARRIADSQEAAAASTRDREGAERDLGRAQRDAAEANADAADAVADAMQGLADAQQDAGAAAGGGAGKFSEFNEAMKKLGPEGQAFVKQLLKMKDKLDDLKKSVAAKFLPGVTQMLKDSEVLFPIFEKGLGNIGTAMGNTARKFGTLFKDAGFQKDLEQMFANAVPIVEKLGDGAVKLLAAFVKLGANKEISEGLGHLVDGILTGLLGLMDKLNANGGNFGKTLAGWGDVIAWLLPLAGDILGWISNLDPRVTLLAGAFLLLATKAGPLVGILKPLVGLLGGIGKSADDNKGKVGGFADALKSLRGGGDDDGGSGGGSGGGAAGGKSKKGKAGKGGKLRAVGGAAKKGAKGLGGDGGGMEMAGEVLDGMQNGSDGNWMSWGDDIGAGIRSIGEAIGIVSPKIDEGKAKVSEYVGSATAKIGGLPATANTGFGGVASAAETHMAAAGSSTETHGAGIVGSLGGALGLIPGIGDINFGGLWDTATGWLGGLVDDAGRFAGAATGNVDGGLSGLPGVSDTWFGRMLGGAADKGLEMVRWAGGLPGDIIGSIGNIGTLLFNSGSNLVQGFLDGISRNWSRITSWVEQGMTNLRGLWPFSPAKTGPFSGRGYVTYSGAALTGDFAASLRAGTPGIIASARAAMDAAHGEFAGRGINVAGLVSTMPVASMVGGGGRGQQTVQHVEIHNHIAGSVLAEQQLMGVVQKHTSRYAGRNTNNGLTGR